MSSARACAAQIKKYGGSDVVEINTNTPKPTISPGHIVVEVHAVGLNPSDWKIRQGYFSKGESKGEPPTTPLTLGGDFSGIVVEVGENVSDFKKNDAVYGTALTLAGGSGALAEFASANVKNVAFKPKNINHIEASALPLAGSSAVQALTEHMELSKCQKILIHGGAGGIGSFAIQLAKHLGAYVATTASTDDTAYVKTLGADTVIDYTKENFAELLKAYDAVYDTVGGETYKKSFKVLKSGGIIVSMLEKPDEALMKQYGVRAIAQGTLTNTAHLTELAKLVEAGAIKVHVDKIFPLEQAGEALSYLEKGHPKGKVVVEIQ